MTSHRICKVEGLPPGGRLVAEVAGREVVVINSDGVFYAVRNRCAHQGGPIGEGPLTRTVVATQQSDWEPEIAFDGRALRCPSHGLEYDLETGQAICYPRYRVKVYETRVRDGYLEVLV